jgi:hypothetical protein
VISKAFNAAFQPLDQCSWPTHQTHEADGMPEDYWPRWSGVCNLGLMDEAGISLAILSSVRA